LERLFWLPPREYFRAPDFTLETSTDRLAKLFWVSEIRSGELKAQTKRVVLTGGAGFIGSHLATELLKRGLQLTIIDNLDSFYSPGWKRMNLQEIGRQGSYEFVETDICHTAKVREVLAAARPDSLIHLAARAGVRPSIEEPVLYEEVNVRGSLNLLETCRELGIPQFIFGSSSSVYGASSRAPFSEDQVQMQPISPYAATKLAGELLGYTYAHLYGIHVICLRFFTVYGPRQRPDLAIHKFLALLEAGKPIPFFGDGSSGRDYTYVDDIVDGIIAAIDYVPTGVPGAPFSVFNLGNSHPVKLTELVATLEEVSGRKAVLDRQPMQPGDVPLTWANIDKARRLLGYRPATSLAEGLEAFVTWYRAADQNRLS
jgi:UDP-glucuronate 4-epimerase